MTITDMCKNHLSVGKKLYIGDIFSVAKNL